MAPEILAQRNLGDFLGRLRIHQAQRIDINCLRPRFVANAEIVKGMKTVRADLDTGPDLAQFRRQLKHQRRKTILRKARSRSKAANAAPGNEYGSIRHISSPPAPTPDRLARPLPVKGIPQSPTEYLLHRKVKLMSILTILRAIAEI